MLVSVIVTNFNKKNTLERAVRSILNQSYRDIEILIIDDGSTDGSLSLCNSLAKEDGRVNVFYKKNGGELSARKAGLKIAKGEYVLFVDADDWIDKDMVRDLLMYARDNDSDIVTSGWIIHNGDAVVEEPDRVPKKVYRSFEERQEVASFVFFQSGRVKSMNDSLNTKLFRKKLIKKYIELIKDTIVYAEDTFLVLTCMANAECVSVTDKCYYHYMTEDSTLNNEKNQFLMRDLNEGMVYVRNLLPRNQLYEIYDNQLERIVLFYLFLGMNKFMDFSEKHRIIRYTCPEKIIPEGKKIVLYGAGVVGQSYYAQLKRRCEIVVWVDSNYSKYEKVLSVEYLRRTKWDNIIVAIKDEETVQKIKQSLINDYGVPEKDILWEKPMSILDVVMEEF